MIAVHVRASHLSGVSKGKQSEWAVAPAGLLARNGFLDCVHAVRYPLRADLTSLLPTSSTSYMHTRCARSRTRI